MQPPSALFSLPLAHLPIRPPRFCVPLVSAAEYDNSKPRVEFWEKIAERKAAVAAQKGSLPAKKFEAPKFEAPKFEAPALPSVPKFELPFGK